MPTPTVKGKFTTIRWGTTGVLQSPLAGSGNTAAIVKSIKCARLGGGPTKIEDNDGYTAIVVGLVDGDKVDITVVDDTSKSWPAPYDVISLKGPNDTVAKNFLVLEPTEDLARKREGERTFSCEYYSAFTLS
jgi:predicted RNA-binding protein with TRAM domain